MATQEDYQPTGWTAPQPRRRRGGRQPGISAPRGALGSSSGATGGTTGGRPAQADDVRGGPAIGGRPAEQTAPNRGPVLPGTVGSRTPTPATLQRSIGQRQFTPWWKKFANKIPSVARDVATGAIVDAVGDVTGIPLSPLVTAYSLLDNLAIPEPLGVASATAEGVPTGTTGGRFTGGGMGEMQLGALGAMDIPPGGFSSSYDWWRRGRRGYGGGGYGGGGGGYDYMPSWMLGLNQWNYGE